MMNAVNLYIDDLTPVQKQLAVKIRALIFELVPNVQEKFSYKLPFYHFFGIFCYLNKIPNGLDVCFCRGQDLLDEFPQLLSKKRKLVASIELFSLQQIKEKELKLIITTAAIWNEEAYKNGVSIFKKNK